MSKPTIGDPVEKWVYTKRKRIFQVGKKYRGLYCAVKGYRRRKSVVDKGKTHWSHSPEDFPPG